MNLLYFKGYFKVKVKVSKNNHMRKAAPLNFLNGQTSPKAVIQDTHAGFLSMLQFYCLFLYKKIQMVLKQQSAGHSKRLCRPFVARLPPLGHGQPRPLHLSFGYLVSLHDFYAAGWLVSRHVNSCWKYFFFHVGNFFSCWKFFSCWTDNDE